MLAAEDVRCSEARSRQPLYPVHSLNRMLCQNDIVFLMRMRAEMTPERAGLIHNQLNQTLLHVAAQHGCEQLLALLLGA